MTYPNKLSMALLIAATFCGTASATSLGFESNWQISTGTGLTVDGTSGTLTLDFSSTTNNLNGTTFEINEGEWMFFNLGSLILDEEDNLITADERNNLSMNIAITLDIGTFNIATSKFSFDGNDAINGDGRTDVVIDFGDGPWGYSDTIHFGGTGVLTAWIYDGGNYTTGKTLEFSKNGGGDDVWLKLWLREAPTQSQVPEPGTMGLLGAGLIALGYVGRRKQNRS